MKFLNKITSIASACFLTLALTGCSDYLDVSDEVAENLTLDEVFDNPNYMRRWHGNLFNCISEYSSIGRNKTNNYPGAGAFSGVWVSMCGETTISAAGWSEMISGFTSANAPYQRWTPLYQYIRDAKIFLDRVNPKGGINDQFQLTEADVKRMKAEAKYLIAYSYFSLFEMYGPVPILDELADPEDKGLDYARASVDETVEYIDNLLKEVIESGDLPETIIQNQSATGNDRYNLNEIVRPTMTVAKALRAKLWVYAASPLFNGGYKETLDIANTDGKKIFSSYDANKWVTAKSRLEDLLNNAEQNKHTLFTVYNTDGTINPDESVYQLFQNYTKYCGLPEPPFGPVQLWNRTPTPETATQGGDILVFLRI